MTDQPTYTATAPPTKNKNWIWLFAVLFILSALAAGINLTYNMRQQLTPEQLFNAKSTWERFGPHDYDLTVHKNVAVPGSDGGIKDVIEVQVRNRMVTDMRINGKPAERRLWSQYDMAGWFDWIQRNLDMDRLPKAPRVFCIGHFDLSDGHPIKYVRSVSGSGDRQELNFELKLP